MALHCRGANPTNESTVLSVTTQQQQSGQVDEVLAYSAAENKSELFRRIIASSKTISDIGDSPAMRCIDLFEILKTRQATLAQTA